MPLTDPRRFRRLLLSAILLPVVLLLLLAAILLWAVDALLGAQEEARRSQETLYRVERVRLLLIDRKTGLRGYLLTGDPAFLEPYQAAGERLPQALARLEESLAGSPEQRARMARLRERQVEWEGVAAEQLSLFRERGDWLSLVRSGAGKARMDALRATLDDLAEEERQRMSQRREVAERGGRTVLAAGLLWALLVGVLLAWHSRRQLLSLARDYENSLGKVVTQADALRAIDGFSQALREDEAERLSPDSLLLLDRLQAAATRMGQLIDDLLPGFDAPSALGVLHASGKDIPSSSSPAAWGSGRGWR